MSNTTNETAKKEEGGAYFKEWYQENGDKLNKSRKRRYHDDPEYREKVLEQNRDARKKRREAQLVERHKEGAAKKTRVDRSWKTRDMVLTLDDGSQVTVKGFTIGAVAQLLGCSVQAIRLWEKKGVLPETDFRFANRDRLYTSEMIDIYEKVLEEQGRLNPNKTRPTPMRMTTRHVKFANGKVAEIELWRIGVLAKAANRTVVTLEQLEQKDILPETPFRASELGYRLYTEEMIASVAQAFESRMWEVRGEDEWKKFRQEIINDWKKQGVIGARILKRKPAEQAKKPDKPRKK